MDKKKQDFLLSEVVKRFLRYVKIETTSDSTSGSHPSSKNQWELAKLLKKELIQLGLVDVEVSEHCYVYGTLPASSKVVGASITFCAHLDTDESVSANSVIPVIHKNYSGGEIRFPDDPDLVLTPLESPELNAFIGSTIITSSGRTLLGADDKAGIAEIMTALLAFKEFPELSHPEIKIVFTPDEEIGEGVDYIDLEKLAPIAYTVDGGMMGEYDVECFDAIGVELIFYGINVHPGSAKGKMVNAIAIACRLIGSLPEAQSPENTSQKDGFYHLGSLSGNESEAKATLIIRDFNSGINKQRIAYIRQVVQSFEIRYPGLRVDIKVKNQYRNMKTVLDEYPETVERLDKAISETGLKPLAKSIRGGTDGSKLCFLGIPTPNIFTGGLLFHSKKEWIADLAMLKATETIINLCKAYSEALDSI